MSASEEENTITAPATPVKSGKGSFSKINLIFLAVIAAVIIASVIVGAAGDAVARKAEYNRKISQPDYGNIAKIFERERVFQDDDPDYGVVEYFLTESPNYNETKRVEIKGLMLHSIGVEQTSAKKQADSYSGKDFRYAGVHGFIDSETGEFYHTLPWSQEAWHAGEDAGNYIAVEMCETEAGYYTDDYVLHVEDEEKAKFNAQTAYDAAVALFARLCVKYELDPLEDGAILSHREGALRGIATKHGDPDEYWENVGVDFTMDGFRQDVKHYMDNNIAAYMQYPRIRQVLKKYTFHEKA